MRRSRTISTKERIDQYLTALVAWGRQVRVDQDADPVAQERLARMRRLRATQQQRESVAQLSESA